MLTVYVISDATGETAERMLNSALVQFKNAPVTIIRRGKIRTTKQVRELVEEAAGLKSLIVHTLIAYDLRRFMLAESRSKGVDSLDLVGPMLDRLISHLRLMPRQKPGLLKQLDKAKSREIDAVAFAFRHDDGQRVESLKEAEVVLVGVSRTMKTPTTLYLAYLGWFAANVPIIMEVPLPRELLKLPHKRVFCLTMTPVRLLELRRSRADAFKMPEGPYASQTYVRQELINARRLCRDYGWRQIDVTDRSVEEVARQIIMLLSPKDPGRDPAW